MELGMGIRWEVPPSHPKLQTRANNSVREHDDFAVSWDSMCAPVYAYAHICARMHMHAVLACTVYMLFLHIVAGRTIAQVSGHILTESGRVKFASTLALSLIHI